MKVINRHFSTLNSTNSWAMDNALSLDKNSINMISADEQTAGRGRFRKKWSSSACTNILTSFAFFIPKGQLGIANISQVMAVSAIKCLKELGFNTCLKWPNDLLISDKKVGGILCETKTIRKMIFVVVGIGINVNSGQTELSEIEQPATSLLIEAEKFFPRNEILTVLKKHFLHDLDLFLKKGFSPFLSEYNQYIIHKPDDLLQFNAGKTTWEGFFDSISDCGAINLKLKSGEAKSFSSGEVFSAINQECL